MVMTKATMMMKKKGGGNGKKKKLQITERERDDNEVNHDRTLEKWRKGGKRKTGDRGEEEIIDCKGKERTQHFLFLPEVKVTVMQV